MRVIRLEVSFLELCEGLDFIVWFSEGFFELMFLELCFFNKNIIRIYEFVCSLCF